MCIVEQLTIFLVIFSLADLGLGSEIQTRQYGKELIKMVQVLREFSRENSTWKNKLKPALNF